jgi:hypothetical protein
MDQRDLRLYDLAPHETIRIRCRCGRMVEFMYGVLQRRHHMRSDTLLFDLQFRFRCQNCNLKSGFRISIYSERYRGNAAVNAERVIVPGRARAAPPPLRIVK